MSSSSSAGGGYTTRVESFTVKIEDEEIKLRTKLYRPGGELQMELVLVLVYRHIARIVQSSQDHLAPLAFALATQGACRALTFDTRGIGRSTGDPSLSGSDEVRDVIAVCTWAARNLPSCSTILLVGCSAGAAIAGSALDQIPQAVGCVAISYPFGLVASYLVGRHYKAMLRSQKQRLFIMGDQDWFTSQSQFKAKVCSAAPPRDSQVFKQGKGHCPIQTPSFVAQVVNYILHTFIPTLTIN